MITFKQQITVEQDLVDGLAQSLGYGPTIIVRQGGDLLTQTNPETTIEFIDRLAKKHTENFFLPFGKKLVEQQLAVPKAQLEQLIINPVMNALVTEVVIGVE